MTKEKIQDITTDRLARWAKKSIANHATPVIMVHVGHDHNSGQIGICTTEDMDNRTLKAFLQQVIRQL